MILNKKLQHLFLGLLLVLSSCFTQALEKEAYTEQRFEELQAQDAVILVDVFATWCPTCAKQQILIDQYRKKHPKNDFHLLVIDYDRDKALVEKYNAPRQSTLVLFKGETQLWHSVAEKDFAKIELGLNKAF